MVAFGYNNVAHTMFAGRIEEFKQLVDFMERTYYYPDGTVYRAGIRRLLIDSQGYYEKETTFNEDTNRMEDAIIVNRPQEVREFVYEFSQYFGVSGEYDRVIATRGSQHLPNDEPYSWTTSRLTINNYKDSRQIKVMKLNTTSLKLSVMQRLYRSIEKAKANELDAAYDYTHRLRYINQKIIDVLSSAESIDMKAYIHQHTSEVYAYPKDKRGNAKPRKAFVQVKKENHLFDCFAAAEGAYLLDNLQTVKKPIEGQDKDKVFSVARSLV